MVWHKRNPKWGYNKYFDYLLGAYRRRSLSTRDHHTDCRGNRRHHNYRGHRHYFYYFVAVYLLAVGPAYADEPRVQNTSNPVAAATGNVTNQAVQFQNNGAPSRQYFAGSNSCNGPTMTLSPFMMGNETRPVDPEGYVKNANWGAQVNFMIPLDSGMIEQCKAIAKRHEQKMRLNYELIRAEKCADLQRKGFTFRPGSRVEHLCSDIVPIVSINNAGSSSERSDSRNSGGSSSEQSTSSKSE